MYEVQKELRPVQLFDATGYFWTYRDLFTFVDKYGINWIRTNCGTSFHTVEWEIDYSVGIQERAARGWRRVPKNVDWYILRFSGETTPITYKDIQELLDWETPYRAKFYIPKWRPFRVFKFRNGPVPYTRGHCGRASLRHPKTTQERRWAVAHDDELKEYNLTVRPRRNYTNLITAWDDKWPIVQKSWKKHRKTQWK